MVDGDLCIYKIVLNGEYKDGYVLELEDIKKDQVNLSVYSMENQPNLAD